MKAAYIERTGPPEVIQYGDLPDPTPGDDQVLVRVEAVSLNPVDTYIRAGTIPFDLPKPFVVGCDLAGTVEAVGKNVTRFKPGDRVWGSNQGLLGRQGTFSELAAVDECWLYPIPEGVSAQDAAAVSLVGITAHLGLFRDAQLKPGEILYVHGGTGGVGSCVVQMGKAAGAVVVTSAGSPEKAARCRELGADHVILYKEENEAEALERIAPEGVDVWYETLREQDFDLIVSHLRPRGRIVVMAGRDARPPFPIGPFYVKDCKMFGFAMFNAPPEEQERCALDINRWMVEGKLKPMIGRVMKLSETAEAHRLQEDNTLNKAGTLQGKIVLVP
ncbi:zinc-binding dehydrogenase [Thermostilla marina]